MTYTDAQRQEWERACARVYLVEATYPQYPSIGDATATLTMLEWLADHDPAFMLDKDGPEWWVNCEFHDESLVLALVPAVNGSKS